MAAGQGVRKRTNWDIVLIVCALSILRETCCFEDLSDSTEARPWWLVDLGGTHCIGKVTLLNRLECCNSRLAGAVVRVGSSSSVFRNPACGSPVTLAQAAVPGGWVVIECNPAMAGRYISVDIDFGSGVTNALTLCEVRVKEYDFDVCSQTYLPLQGKKATQSTTYSINQIPLEANLAVDGDTNGALTGPNKCSYTVGAEAHPWWKVDLGGSHYIHKITLVNREDCCGERLAYAVVRVGYNSNILQNSVCGLPVTPTQAASRGWVVIECNPALAGRYISVDVDHSTKAVFLALTLCEVIVDGYNIEVCGEKTEPSFATTSGEFKLIHGGRCSSHVRPLETVSTKSIVRCTMLCKRITKCKSFEYDLTLGQCRLYSGRRDVLKTDPASRCLFYVDVTSKYLCNN